MLIKLKANIPEIILGMLLAVAIFAMGMIFESSRQPPSNQTTAENADHGSAVVAANKVPEITDWLLVLFNGLLFGSTVLLWVANNRSAKIAERALTDLERAYIFIDKIGGYFDPFVSVIDESGISRYIVPAFSLSLINYGRTAGCIDIAIIRFEVLKEIPPEIQTANITLETATEDPKALGVEMIIGPDKTHTFDRLGLESLFTQNHGDGIKAGTMDIYCHGFFAYRDIFNQSHRIKFCRKYVHRHQEWASEGGRARNVS